MNSLAIEAARTLWLWGLLGVTMGEEAGLRAVKPWGFRHEMYSTRQLRFNYTVLGQSFRASFRRSIWTSHLKSGRPPQQETRRDLLQGLSEPSLAECGWWREGFALLRDLVPVLRRLVRIVPNRMEVWVFDFLQVKLAILALQLSMESLQLDFIVLELVVWIRWVEVAGG